MDEEETTRGDDDKKTGLYPYEVLVESFDYTIVACTFEPMMSVLSSKTREREEGREFLFLYLTPTFVVKSENKQQQHKNTERERE